MHIWEEQTHKHTHTHTHTHVYVYVYVHVHVHVYVYVHVYVCACAKRPKNFMCVPRRMQGGRRPVRWPYLILAQQTFNEKPTLG